jgi:hypothetical protein
MLVNSQLKHINNQLEEYQTKNPKVADRLGRMRKIINECTKGQVKMPEIEQPNYSASANKR